MNGLKGLSFVTSAIALLFACGGDESSSMNETTDKNCATWGVMCSLESSNDMYQMCQECWPAGDCSGKAAESFGAIQCAIQHDYCFPGSPNQQQPSEDTMTAERCDAVKVCAAEKNVLATCGSSVQ